MPRIAAFGGFAGLIAAPGKIASAEEDSEYSAVSFGVGAVGNAAESVVEEVESGFAESAAAAGASETLTATGICCGRLKAKRAAARNIQ